MRKRHQICIDEVGVCEWGFIMKQQKFFIFSVPFLTCVLIVMLISISPVSARLTGMVSGKVIDADGNGIKGVQVMLRSLDGSNPNRTAKTSKSGRYRFNAVIPGNYVVIASIDGFDHKNQQVIRVSSNGKIKLDLFMEKAEEPSGELTEKNAEEGDIAKNDPKNSHVVTQPGGNGAVDPGSGGGKSPSEIQRP